MTDKWLYLNTVRNPHLALAEALQDGRRTEWGSLNSGDWYASDNGDIGLAMMFPHEQHWHKWRVERRPQSDELGPCPVCGSEFGNGWVMSEWPMCSDCGFMCDSVNQWNKLRYVD